MIPLSTTTIAVLRIAAGDEYDEPYAGEQPSDRDVVAQGVRAVIDHPTGTLEVEGGQQAVAVYGLKCDPVDLHYLDMVRDEPTGRTFHVRWLLHYPGHVEAGLRSTEGEV